MNWSTLAIVALVTLVAAGLLIALVEKWSLLAPALSRWSWVVEGPLALLWGYSAAQSFSLGDSSWGSLSALLAVMFGWSALAGVRRSRKWRPG
jgi:hypothetical protein